MNERRKRVLAIVARLLVARGPELPTIYSIPASHIIAGRSRRTVGR